MKRYRLKIVPLEWNSTGMGSCTAGQEPGPVLMCWRALWLEAVEDRGVESMSSAG